jgi:hypothetical protein
MLDADAMWMYRVLSEAETTLCLAVASATARGQVSRPISFSSLSHLSTSK